MLRYPLLALITLVATPVLATPNIDVDPQAQVAPVDRLYPEIVVNDDGWRGLLPVILLDPDEVAEAPPANGEHSEAR